MKTIFLTGKGGVGKSTVSAAVAWQLAEKGSRVLSVSLDPAHNLGDIFGLKLTERKHRYTENLYLSETNLEKASAAYIRQSQSLLTETYGYLKTLNMDSYFDLLKYSPGIEEYAVLTALEQMIRTERDFDFIVFDMPPTGLTLRILALPRITISWIDRLSVIRRKILEKRYTVYNIRGKDVPEGARLSYREEDDRVLEKLKEMHARYSAVRTFLEGSDNSVVLVFNPDYLSLKESERIIKGLGELEMPLRVAFDNKVTEENREIADQVEKTLFPTPAGGVVLDRIPLIGHPLPACYLMEQDISHHFDKERVPH